MPIPKYLVGDYEREVQGKTGIVKARKVMGISDFNESTTYYGGCDPKLPAEVDWKSGLLI